MIGKFFAAVAAGAVAVSLGAATVDVDSVPGYAAVEAPGMMLRGETGAPALPSYVENVSLPDNALVTGVRLEAKWRVISEGVELMAVQEPVATEVGSDPMGSPIGSDPGFAASFVTIAPDYYMMDVYPATNVAWGAATGRKGARYLPVEVTPFRYYPATKTLEEAYDIEVKVDYLKGMSAMTAEGGYYEAESILTNAEYIIISPPNMVDAWKWYIGERAKVHTNLTYAVVNTFDIYDAIPFDTNNTATAGTLGDDSLKPRNAAESIHAYLRQNWLKFDGNMKYVVMGGPWIDADKEYTPFWFITGEEASLSNCVPGITSYPRYKGEAIPTDLFYACVDQFTGSQSGIAQENYYPWDANGDGLYLMNECANCDTIPEYCVSRMTMKPDEWYYETYQEGTNTVYRYLTAQELVTNYVAKLARGESDTFAGSGKFGVHTSTLDYNKYYKSNGCTIRNELEFYDGIYNTFDPRHPEPFIDHENVSRKRWREVVAPVRPIHEVRSLHGNNIQNRECGNASGEHENFYFPEDREFAFHYGHGWAGGSGEFGFERFAKCTGLTLFNDIGVSCQTGWLDYYKNINGLRRAKICLGEAGVGNPKGGTLCSMNNTRSGWVSIQTTAMDGDWLSIWQMEHLLENFLVYGMNAGDAYLKMQRDKIGSGLTNTTQAWALCTAMLFGDPLVEPKVPVDYTDTLPGGVGYIASNITYTAAADISVTKPVATVFAHFAGDTTVSDGTLLSGAYQTPGSTVVSSNVANFRVSRNITSSGSSLTFKVNGGAGTGVVFTGTDPENTGTVPGKITLETPVGACFYLGGVSNVEEIVVKDNGAVIDFNNSGAYSGKLVFTGTVPNGAGTVPAVLRADAAKGYLASAPTIGVTNTSLRVETWEAFAGTVPAGTVPIFTGKDADIRFTQNRWAGKSGYYETISRAITLDSAKFGAEYMTNLWLSAANFAVSGDSMLYTSDGAAISLKGETVATLADAQATLAIDATFIDQGSGAIRIVGPGTATIENADGLAGALAVEGGATIEFTAIPMPNVKDLAIGDDTTVILPEDADGFYRIIPITGTMSVGTNVTVLVRDAEGNTHAIDCESTPTGAFFETASLYNWCSDSTYWSLNANDLAWSVGTNKVSYKNGGSAAFPATFSKGSDPMGLPMGSDPITLTVKVADAIESDFVYFLPNAGDTATTYLVTADTAATKHSLVFDSMLVAGEVAFSNIELTVANRIDIEGGCLAATNLETPIINVDNGGYLELGSSNTTSLAEVSVSSNSAFALTTDATMWLRLEDGVTLVAKNDKRWTITENVVVTIPETMKLDITELDLTGATNEATAVTLIDGAGYTWTFDDLFRFTLVGTDVNPAVLRVYDGKLCVIKGKSGFGKEYTINLITNIYQGTASWNGQSYRGLPLNGMSWNQYNTTWYEPWIAEDGQWFSDKWSNQPVDLTGTAIIRFANNQQTIFFDTDVCINKIKFVAVENVTNSYIVLARYAPAPSNVDYGGSLKAQIIDFTEAQGRYLKYISLGTGLNAEGALLKIGEGYLKVADNTSATIDMQGGIVAFTQTPSGNVGITSGSSGSVYVVIASDSSCYYERRKIFKIDEDFDINNLNIQACSAIPDDRDGSPTTISGFSFVKDGDGIYIVPPEATATVSADCNFSEMTISNGKVSGATPSDWSLINNLTINCTLAGATVTLDTISTGRLTIKGSAMTIKAPSVTNLSDKLVTLPSDLVISNDLTVVGEILPEIPFSCGPGSLVLQDCGEVAIPALTDAGWPFSLASLTLNGTTKMTFAHTDNLQQHDSDWSKLKGNGTIEWTRNKAGVYMSLPSSNGRFSEELTFINNTDIPIDERYTEENPFVCRNLQGSGTFRADYCITQPGAGVRWVKSVQTTNTTWSGNFYQFNDVRSIRLAIASDETGVPSSEKVLTITGKNDSVDTYTRVLPSGAVHFKPESDWTLENTNGLIVVDAEGAPSNISFTGERNYVYLNGGTLDFTDSVYTNQDFYTYLTAGSTGIVKFWSDYDTVSEGVYTDVFDREYGVCGVATNALAGPLTLISVGESEVKWSTDYAVKEYSSDFISPYALYWLGTTNTIHGVEPKTIELAKESTELSETDVMDWSLVSDLTVKLSSTVDPTTATSPYNLNLDASFSSYTGTLKLEDGVKLTGAQDLDCTLLSSPTGTIRFVVSNAGQDQPLVDVADDFAYAPDQFDVEVVDETGANTAAWTWLVEDGQLKYKTVTLGSPIYGYHFTSASKYYDSYGSSSVDLWSGGTFVKSGNGYAVQGKTNFGTNFSWKYDRFTLFTVMKLSETASAVHFALGTKGTGGFTLVGNGEDEVTLCRWTANGAAVTNLITGKVPLGTIQYHSFAVVYREGYFKLFIDGEKVGAAMDIEPATRFSNGWGFSQVAIDGYSGWRPTGLKAGTDACYDELQFYGDAFSDSTAALLADDYPAWPKKRTVTGTTLRSMNATDLTDGLIYDGGGKLWINGTGEIPVLWAAEDTKLVIDGTTVLCPITSTKCALASRPVDIWSNGTLSFTYSGDVDATGYDFSDIGGDRETEGWQKGYGTVNFTASATNSVITLGTNLWDRALTLDNLGAIKFTDYAIPEGTNAVFTGSGDWSGKVTLSGKLRFAPAAGVSMDITELAITNATDSARVELNGSGTLTLGYDFAPVFTAESHGTWRVLLPKRLGKSERIATLAVEDAFVYPASGLVFTALYPDGAAMDGITFTSTADEGFVYATGSRDFRSLKLMIRAR